MATTTKAPDVLVANAFTTFVFTPLTSRGKRWIAQNVQSEPWQWLGASLVVETRYAWGLAMGMKRRGVGAAMTTPTAGRPKRIWRQS
jgi:hypothetical protein